MNLASVIGSYLPELMGNFSWDPWQKAYGDEGGVDARSFDEYDYVTDTRKMNGGSRAIFVPLVGQNYDGHDFIDEAISKGACGYVYDPHRFRSRQPGLAIAVPNTLKAYQAIAHAYRAHRIASTKVVAISGSCGKTTLKTYLSDLLSHFGTVWTTRANENNEIGVAKTLLECPESMDYLICEMGMRKKTDLVDLVWMARPDISLLTCVEKSHLSCVKSFDEVYQGKLELFRCVPKAHWIGPEFDPRIMSVLMGSDKSSCFSGGFAEVSQLPGVRVVATELNIHQITTKVTLALHDPPEKLHTLQLITPSVHKFAPRQLAAAVAAAWTLVGSRIHEVTEKSIGAWPCGRFTLLKSTQGHWVIDDTYNASPASMKAGLESASEFVRSIPFPKPHITLIIGDMLELGQEGPALHHELGQWLFQTFGNRQDQLRIMACGQLAGPNVLAGYTSGGGKRSVIHIYDSPEDLLVSPRWQNLMEDLHSPQRGNQKHLVFLKASHGTQLYKLAAYFSESEGKLVKTSKKVASR